MKRDDGPVRAGDLRAYEVAEILPRLSGEWSSFRRGLVRQTGYVIQSIALYGFANWSGFRVHFALQLTIVPEEHVHGLLGGTLRHRVPRWAHVPWLGSVSSELWIDWAQRHEWTDRIIALLHEQVAPPIAAPLTVASAAALVRRHTAESRHHVIHWTAALLTALQGQRAAAAIALRQLKDRMSDEIAAAQAPGQTPIGDFYSRDRDSIAAAIDALGSESNFASYCAATSRATVTNLGLPRAPAA